MLDTSPCDITQQTIPRLSIQVKHPEYRERSLYELQVGSCTLGQLCMHITLDYGTFLALALC